MTIERLDTFKDDDGEGISVELHKTGWVELVTDSETGCWVCQDPDEVLRLARGLMHAAYFMKNRNSTNC